ncbi:hypothetical protein L798_10376 [Zootermopsis nevadensis]|uniref:Uncharacterized protein n=1 Tax=Zootermopsis nevadensis TaxID=136037 RepID=A0A067R9P6_ZOONE|nr:hypothetical protein L798_10376 [Zootermopsis nevadensis]
MHFVFCKTKQQRFREERLTGCEQHKPVLKVKNFKLGYWTLIILSFAIARYKISQDDKTCIIWRSDNFTSINLFDVNTYIRKGHSTKTALRRCVGSIPTICTDDGQLLYEILGARKRIRISNTPATILAEHAVTLFSFIMDAV